MSRALFVVTVLAGCYDPSIRDGAPCSPSGACPEGQQCYSGTCLAEAPGDATLDGPAPDAAAAWSAPVEIPGVNTAGDERDPCMSADRLTILFARSNDIYIGTRMSVTAAFTVQPLAEINSTSEEASPELTANGTVLYFSSDRITLGSRDVYRSVRQGTTWQAPTMVDELSSPTADDGDVAISPDGLTVFVVRNNVFLKATRATPASTWSTLSSTGTAWGGDAAAPSINAAGDVYLHAKSPRELLVSRRSGTSYATPVLIPELARPATREAGPYISADDQRIYFERSGDLYESHR